MDARFAREMAAAEVAITSPTTRDRAKQAAWLGLAARLTPPPLVGWSGAPVAGLEQRITGTWMARNTWDNLTKGEWLGANADFVGYVKAHPDRAADIGVPLIPHDQSAATWNSLLDQAISGAQDATYAALGKQLALLGPATVYARLWWEFNMAPVASNIDRAKFVAAWNRAVPLIRSGFASAARAGQVLKVVWCPLADGADYAPFWPASSTVDVVALDAYGAVWSTTTPTATALLGTVNTRLNAIASFAATKGKPVALGEWGNWLPGPVDGTATSRGRGDFPEYVDAVFDWAAKNAAEYLCYFNIADGGVGQTLTQTPLSLARLLARAG